MKHVVVTDDLREAVIRPRPLLEEYIRLLEADVRRFLDGRVELRACPCPGCGGQIAAVAFRKLGFEYQRCAACRSLFVSPRPSAEAIDEFVRSAGAIAFWRREFSAATAQERNRGVFRPRARWIEASLGSYTGSPGPLVDVQTKSVGLLQAIADLGVFPRCWSVAPQVDDHELRAVEGVEVIDSLDTLVAARAGQAGVVVAHECLERAPDAPVFVDQVVRLLRPGGLLFATTLSASGFDIQVLGPRSRSLQPPLQLNVLTLEGLQRLLERHGLELLELSTPGQLDTEIVRHALEEEPTLVLPPFASELVAHRDEAVHQAFQEFLQGARLSSHVRLAARRVD
jgi:hypothetical protein